MLRHQNRQTPIQIIKSADLQSCKTTYHRKGYDQDNEDGLSEVSKREKGKQDDHFSVEGKYIASWAMAFCSFKLPAPLYVVAWW